MNNVVWEAVNCVTIQEVAALLNEQGVAPEMLKAIIPIGRKPESEDVQKYDVLFVTQEE
jgi:hypothetical protein